MLVDKVTAIPETEEVKEDVNPEKESVEPADIDSSVTEEQHYLPFGMYICKGILLPRAKKPELSGYYLKQNTSEQIQTMVFFDGAEYTETQKCQSGKMYSVDGMIYVFDGTTCKLLGL